MRKEEYKSRKKVHAKKGPSKWGISETEKLRKLIRKAKSDRK